MTFAYDNIPIQRQRFAQIYFYACITFYKNNCLSTEFKIKEEVEFYKICDFRNNFLQFFCVHVCMQEIFKNYKFYKENVIREQLP